MDSVVALVESAYRGPPSAVGWTTEAKLLDGQRTDAAGVRDVIDRAASRMLLALDAAAGDLVGCCQLERRTDGTGYFGMFAVRPALQGRGLGRSIVAEAERIAVEEWAAPAMTMAVLSPRPELIAWYERLGYRLTGETAPFPSGDDRYGRPKVADLSFVMLRRTLP